MRDWTNQGCVGWVYKVMSNSCKQGLWVWEMDYGECKLVYCWVLWQIACDVPYFSHEMETSNVNHMLKHKSVPLFLSHTHFLSGLWSCRLQPSAVQRELQGSSRDFPSDASRPSSAAARRHHAVQSADGSGARSAVWTRLARRRAPELHKPHHVRGRVPHSFREGRRVSSVNRHAENGARFPGVWSRVPSAGRGASRQPDCASVASERSFSGGTAAWRASSAEMHLRSDSAQNGRFRPHAFGWNWKGTNTCVHAVGVTGEYSPSCLLEPVLHAQVIYHMCCVGSDCENVFSAVQKFGIDRILKCSQKVYRLKVSLIMIWLTLFSVYKS